ncbi:hypothetical protein [Paraburkholderia ferrariae]|uniref:hypothetical protein n=1 Tax=Paraburkholderia ferrariae TaxID=386056 RepID=UPI000694CE9C|nr:hypothetical protein [Paraburkholderia ferrariae]
MQHDIRNSLEPLWQVFLDFTDTASGSASEPGSTDTAAGALLARAALALRALDAVALANMVSTALETGQLADAIRIAAAVARLAPERADAHFMAGLALQFAGRHADAVEPYRRAFAIAPDFPHLRNNLAISLMQINSCGDEIQRLLEAAAAHDPSDPKPWINLARLRPDETDIGRPAKAARRALALAPHDPLALNNSAMALKEMQRWDDAQQAAQAACQYAPNDLSLRFNLSTLQLVRGDFANGWTGHEARWLGASELNAGRPAFAKPQWQGEPIAGRTLLVWGEQGMGDLLQFCRYVPLLAERVHREGGRLVWNSFAQMGALLERSLGAQCDGYSAGGGIETLPAHDCEVSLLSLPLIFGTRADSIPGPARYLAPERDAAARWRERLAGERRLKVGLAWTGSPTHKRNPFRRVDLGALAAHLRGLDDDVAFYSLQPGAQDDVAAARAAGFEMADFSSEWRTFDDTAAFVDSLDLVISVCTSMAHLAGAIGQRTWVLLDVNPHWVWQLERRDSPWYPNTTLYRQKAFRQWSPVLEGVAADLRALAQAPREPR